MEFILGVAFITFILAYLYGKLPEDNRWLKFFFLGLTLFMIFFLSWAMFIAEETRTTQFYDDNGNFTGNQSTVVTLSDETKNAALSLMKISIPIFMLPIAILGLLWALEWYQNIKTKIRRKKGFDV